MVGGVDGLDRLDVAGPVAAQRLALGEEAAVRRPGVVQPRPE